MIPSYQFYQVNFDTQKRVFEWLQATFSLLMYRISSATFDCKNNEEK